MYILALDQGTTSSRALVFDREGRVVSMARKEFGQHYPKPGWVEHDPHEIWSSQAGTAAEAIAAAGLSGRDIAGIGITNQRETTLVWEAATGRPVYPAIVWQDRRTAAFCERLKAEGHEPGIRAKTGLLLDPYFSATKIRWILDQVPGARAEAEAGRLRFGTVDSWLIWNLTRGREHLTDPSNASRTLLFDIRKGTWDEDLCALFGIPMSMLPRVVDSSGIAAESATTLFATKIPISGIAGDQQAALFGQRCIRPGMVKNTYGTGCFLMMHTGAQPVESTHRLLTTVAWGIHGKLEYALEGSIFIGGAVVQWLRDELGLIRGSEEVETLAATVSDTGGVYVVPAFAGLGAPHWDSAARGMVVGLTRGSGAAQLARAALESIAYQTRDVVDAMALDAGIPIRELRVDGGATANNLLMQFQADVLGVEAVRPRTAETTALGAAYLAGLATGYWSGPAEVDAQWGVDRRFGPAMSEVRRGELLEGWNRALRAARAWAAQP